MVVHICNPGTKELEAGGLQVGGQPQLHSQTVSRKSVEVTVRMYEPRTCMAGHGKATSTGVCYFIFRMSSSM